MTTKQVPGYDELLQQLDAPSGINGGGDQAGLQAGWTEAREPAWSYEKFVGFDAPETSLGFRERSEKAYQERATLGEMCPGARLGRAPFKQRVAEAGAAPAGVQQAASLLGGRRPRATVPRVARKSAQEAAKPDCPWRISNEFGGAGGSRPPENLPGLHGLKKKKKGTRSRGPSKDKGGDDRKPERKAQFPRPRRPREAQADDGELLALLGGAPRERQSSRGSSGDVEVGGSQEPPRERSPSRSPDLNSKAEHPAPDGPRGEAHLDGASLQDTQAAEDEGNSPGGTVDDAELRAAEAEVARLAALEEFLSSPDLHEQGSFKIAGTWDDFKHNDMIAVGSRFVYFAPLGDKGWESFQILYKGDWSRTLYPSVADGNPFDEHTVMGPDDNGHGKNWTIGRHARDKGPPGTHYKVELVFGDPDRPMLVRWESAGPEAAARRAREAVLQEAGLGSSLDHPSSASDAAALPPPALRPLSGAWDGVPMNLGQAYDVGDAFTISVDLRAPTGHEEQGGRVLAKRKGRSGWELVAPRRETGGVSFYSSSGGHLNIGTTRVDDFEWHHVAVTFSQQGEMRSYIDGRLDGEVAHIVRPQPEAELWLGTRNEKSGLFLGDLRDVQVFDCALGAEEVAVLCEATVRGRS